LEIDVCLPSILAAGETQNETRIISGLASSPRYTVSSAAVVESWRLPAIFLTNRGNWRTNLNHRFARAEEVFMSKGIDSRNIDASRCYAEGL
jgi:hypothetical protein